jgi:hypothetical protein
MNLILQSIEASIRESVMGEQFTPQQMQERLIETNNKLSQVEEEKRELFRKAQRFEERVKALFKVLIRFLVVLKYIMRAAALAGCYFWLGRNQTIGLAGFIIVVASVQIAIDKVQRVMHPEWEISEWSC